MERKGCGQVAGVGVGFDIAMGVKTESLTLYVREHCHLCDEMQRALEPYCANRGIELQQVDVDSDPVLSARYGDTVPLLAVKDDEICRFQLDVQALLEHLGEVTDPAEDETGGKTSVYTRIYTIVRQIPPGQVATYGQIAKIEGTVTARMVGYAMSAVNEQHDVPWQRVINSQGRLSDRKGGGGFDHQRRCLEAEGVFFDHRGYVDFDQAGWSGPDPLWLERHQCFLAPAPRSKRRRYLGG